MPLSREVYHVGLSFFQHSSNMGRLGRHAAWRADRVVAVVSHPDKPGTCRCGTQLRDPEYVYGRRPDIRPRPAAICGAAALGGGGRNHDRAVADRLAVHVRLFRRRSAPVLAYKSRRVSGAAGGPAVVAGLGPGRSGPGPARAIAALELDPEKHALGSGPTGGKWFLLG